MTHVLAMSDALARLGLATPPSRVSSSAARRAPATRRAPSTRCRAGGGDSSYRRDDARYGGAPAPRGDARRGGYPPDVDPYDARRGYDAYAAPRPSRGGDARIPRRDPAELAEAAAREAREERQWRDAYRRRTAEKKARWSEWDDAAEVDNAERARRADARKARLADRRNPEARKARLAQYRDLSRRADREYAEGIQRDFAADRRRALSRSMRSGGGRYDDTVDGALDWLFTPLVKTTRDIGEWLNEDLETTRGYGAEEWARRSLPPPSSRAPPGWETNARDEWTDDRYYGSRDGRGGYDDGRYDDGRYDDRRGFEGRSTPPPAGYESDRRDVRFDDRAGYDDGRFYDDGYGRGRGYGYPERPPNPIDPRSWFGGGDGDGSRGGGGGSGGGGWGSGGGWRRDDPDAPITAEEFDRLRDERTR